MNIAFLLTPKADVAYIYDDFTVRQVLEKMEHHGYTAVPVINRDGGYVGTITEGDLLWYIKNQRAFDLVAAEQTPVAVVPRRHDNSALPISTDIKDIFTLALDQNFVPVIDDRGIFIGIITRKHILQHCCSL